MYLYATLSSDAWLIPPLPTNSAISAFFSRYPLNILKQIYRVAEQLEKLRYLPLPGYFLFNHILVLIRRIDL